MAANNGQYIIKLGNNRSNTRIILRILLFTGTFDST